MWTVDEPKENGWYWVRLFGCTHHVPKLYNRGRWQGIRNLENATTKHVAAQHYEWWSERIQEPEVSR